MGCWSRSFEMWNWIGRPRAVAVEHVVDARVGIDDQRDLDPDQAELTAEPRLDLVLDDVDGLLGLARTQDRVIVRRAGPSRARRSRRYPGPARSATLPSLTMVVVIGPASSGAHSFGGHGSHGRGRASPRRSLGPRAERPFPSGPFGSRFVTGSLPATDGSVELLHRQEVWHGRDDAGCRPQRGRDRGAGPGLDHGARPSRAGRPPTTSTPRTTGPCCRTARTCPATACSGHGRWQAPSPSDRDSRAARSAAKGLLQDRRELIPLDEEGIVALGRADLAVGRPRPRRRGRASTRARTWRGPYRMSSSMPTPMSRVPPSASRASAIEPAPADRRCRADPSPRPGPDRSPGRTGRSSLRPWWSR